MTSAPLRIGTRGSRLAVAQTRLVAAAITRRSGRPCEIVTVTTHGDVNRASLTQIGGQGVFATELRAALTAGEVDVAVHSLKDLPSAPAPGLTLAAYPAREDARDALCARGGLTLAGLPAGARIGTGSPRRIAQLRAARPDLVAVDLRGNIDSRLARVSGHDDARTATATLPAGAIEQGRLDEVATLDAVILACAGLERLGRTAAITERLDLDRFPTAPGQGVLGIEVRDGERHDGIAELDDPATRAAAEAERGILRGLGAGCSAPIAAHATVRADTLALTAIVYGPDRMLQAQGEASVAEGASLADHLVGDLFTQGAEALIR